jgi:hypothetical protein
LKLIAFLNDDEDCHTKLRGMYSFLLHIISMTISLSLLSWLVSGEVLFELSLSFNVEASKVLLISVFNCNCAENVESKSASEVKCNWVLSAIVPKALEA